MIDVGIVGLDTSHPEAFAEKFDRSADVDVTAVWDGGDVRGADYVDRFCDRFKTTRYDRPTDMVDAVDVAMVLTVNWDTHADLVTPFLHANVPTFVDKPLAGQAADLDRIEAAAGETPLFGGSAVPFHPSFDEFPIAEADRTLYCAGYDDPFYYGAHLIDSVRLLVGAEWRSVEPGPGTGTVVNATFENGTEATLRFDGPQDDSAYGILDVGTRMRTKRVDGTEEAHAQMYDRFLDAFVEAVRGDRDDADRILDGARLLLGAHAALETGTTVYPDSEVLADFHADGESFLADYAPYY